VSELFNPPRILRSWVDQVLAGEHDDDRFETFANEVVSAVEGKTIVSTSRSWDLGRDGRGLGPAHGIFVLSSLRTDIDKPKTDASRLKATTWKIRHVYYAAPRLVSESVMEDHCKAIRAVLGEDVDVDPLSGPQVSELVSSGKAADAFKNHYGGELATIKGALAQDTDDPETRHLELALSTFGASDTRDLRIALGTRLILGLLSRASHSLAELAAGSTAVLGVPAFSQSTVEYYCGILRDGGYVELKSARFEITEKGREKYSADSTEVVATVLSGRGAVRRAVEESLGSSVPEKQWNLIWNALQKALARAFYTRGKQLLEIISTLLDGKNTAAVHRDVLGALVDDVLKKVISDFVSPPQRGAMERAFQDAFLPGDKHGAFDWLAGVAGRFAATCTLGLPAEIAATLTATLKKLRCFLDTDVVISYLCAHEPGNAAARAVIKLNQRLQNDLMITDAVAEEGARHAMKAYTDYRVRVAPLDRLLEWYEIAELESAFTREFEFLRREGKVRADRWPDFIGRYAGEETKRYGQAPPPNTAKMRAILSDESFAIRSPGEQTSRWEAQRDSLAQEMYQEALRINPEADAQIAEHKARIDAEMLIAVSRTMAESQEKGTGERYILITSARRLRNLSNRVRTQLPDIPEVLSLSEAATMASLLPEQPISLGALHGILFEGHFAKTVAPLETLLLRIVRESSSVVLPGATRGVLHGEFTAAIIRESKRTGEAQSEVRTRIDRDPIELAKIAAVAVDALALKKPVDRDAVLRKLEEALGPKKPGGSRPK
jgi:predicted nucleic acid-binding protein